MIYEFSFLAFSPFQYVLQLWLNSFHGYPEWLANPKWNLPILWKRRKNKHQKIQKYASFPEIIWLIMHQLSKRLSLSRQWRGIESRLGTFHSIIDGEQVADHLLWQLQLEWSKQLEAMIHSTNSWKKLGMLRLYSCVPNKRAAHLI